jgi:hypothetical protein
VGAAMAAHKQKVLGGVLALLATAAIIYGVNLFLTSRAAKESQAFARIHAVATAALIPETGEAPKFEDNLPHFKTEKERLEAALKEADGFISGHGSRLRDEAQLLKGALPGGAGARRRGAAHLQLAHRIAGRTAVVPGPGGAGVRPGIDRVSWTRRSRASGSWPSGPRRRANFMRDRALYNKARLLEQKGAAKEAEKVYRDILTELPQSALKDEINDRLAVIEGK